MLMMAECMALVQIRIFCAQPVREHAPALAWLSKFLPLSEYAFSIPRWYISQAPLAETCEFYNKVLILEALRKGRYSGTKATIHPDALQVESSQVGTV